MMEWMERMTGEREGGSGRRRDNDEDTHKGMELKMGEDVGRRGLCGGRELKMGKEMGGFIRRGR